MRSDSVVLDVGATIGAEFAGKGVNVALGPTLNIVRDPRWGRNFETFSEDPYLTGQMAAADIRGIQSQGVMAQAKHAAVYNQETNRNSPADNATVAAHGALRPHDLFQRLESGGFIVEIGFLENACHDQTPYLRVLYRKYMGLSNIISLPGEI